MVDLLFSFQSIVRLFCFTLVPGNLEVSFFLTDMKFLLVNCCLVLNDNNLRTMSCINWCKVIYELVDFRKTLRTKYTRQQNEALNKLLFESLLSKHLFYKSISFRNKKRSQIWIGLFFSFSQKVHFPWLFYWKIFFIFLP